MRSGKKSIAVLAAVLALVLAVQAFAFTAVKLGTSDAADSVEAGVTRQVMDAKPENKTTVVKVTQSADGSDASGMTSMKPVTESIAPSDVADTANNVKVLSEEDTKTLTEIAEKKIKERQKASKFSDKIALTKAEKKMLAPTVIRSWIIGNIIGILPGAGASIACFMGYNNAKQFSKHKEDFGHGAIEGVCGSEAANNAVTGGSLIPMLTLGIPGESVTAVLMGGLIIQGLTPGPELFTKHAAMTYTFFAGFVLVQFFMLFIGMLGCRGFAQISRLSDAILIPCVTVLCFIGSYAIHRNMSDVVVMMIFAGLGYLMRKFDLNTAAVVLALILGPISEKGLRGALRVSGGDIGVLFSSPVCWVLIALSIVGIFSPFLMAKFEKKVTGTDEVVLETDEE